LFYRLHVFPITVPPLRGRPADIPALARHFLALFAAEEGKRIRQITPEALQLLSSYRWPGNIRQLENAVFRAVVLAEGDSIGVSEFPQVTANIAAPAPALIPGQVEELPEYATESLSGSEEPAPLPLRTSAFQPDAVPLLNTDGDVRPLDEIEADLIRYAITHYQGQMSEVARRLRIGRSTLYRKLEALGIGAGEQAEPESVAAERQARKIA